MRRFVDWGCTMLHQGRIGWVAAALGIALAAGCDRAPKPDAYGSFEADEVVVGAETSGVLQWFGADEGQRLAAGAPVATVDTAQLVLERAQVAARRASTDARAREAARQIDALRVQSEIARRQYDRMRRLHEEQAATDEQRDQAERDVRVLEAQVEAARAQHRSVSLESSSFDAHVAQIEDRIRKSRVRNPISGTVLATYADRGEFVQTGQPLYKIAALDSLVLRAYVAETDLARVKLGQAARVAIDQGRIRRELTGKVTWVSPEAEFTPTPIQTREERADLVYAVKIQVPNPDGAIKIGMPADVRFVASASSP